MKLQDLHVLMTVAQAGSMGKAARRLNSTQPAVSRSIAELEHALGVRLLDRHRQGVVPTAYGRALLDGGVAAFDALRQAVKTIENISDPESGELRIGSSPAIAASFVSAVVSRLSRRHPRILFHIVATQWDALHRALNERDVDFLIAPKIGQFASDPHLRFETIYVDSYGVMAGARNRWVKRRHIELTELTDEPWALPPPATLLGSVVMDGLRRGGLAHPRTTVLTGPGEIRMSLLTTGKFLTISPKSVLRFPIRRSDIRVLPVELPIPDVSIGAVSLKHRTLSPVARRFIDHAREVAKPLATHRT